MDRDLVTRTARLARLDLTAEDIRLLANQIGRVLDHFNKIRALDTENGTVREGKVRSWRACCLKRTETTRRSRSAVSAMHRAHNTWQSVSFTEQSEAGA